MNHTAIPAVLGAPFLFIDMWVGARYPDFATTAPWFSGFAGLIYITAWLRSAENLRRLLDNGKRDFGWYAIRILMCTLIIADISNVWAIVSTEKPLLFYILDAGWPISHLLMFPVAWAVIRSGIFRGYQQFLPLLMGLWFPVGMLLGRNDFALYFGGLYSTIVWSLFAIATARATNSTVLSYLTINHKNY
ncbi:hypothetical protein [Emticicia agri]|nr:hypothetical protein [Emticicia agri]